MAAFRSGTTAAEPVRQMLEEWMGDENTADNPLLQIVVATIYNRMGDWNKALVCLKSEATLEHLALRAQILVQMHRVDKAEADLKKMQQLDDDSTLTELTKGWVYCGMGKGMQEQGLYAFQELGAKFGRTLLVLNNVAACHIVLGNYGEADRCIEEAFESGQVGAETLINAIVSAQLQGKDSTLINELVTKLEAVDAHHPWLAARAENEKSFDAVASSFA
jgi:coatomer protein complex subunit epsilon